MRPHLSLLVCLVSLALLGEVVGKGKTGNGKSMWRPEPKGGRGKGWCGKDPKPSVFNKYTKPEKNCSCWWDMTRSDCACCKEDVGKVQQCGYPMHKYCYKKTPNGWGCPGVCQKRYTLSTKGYPCYSNPDRTDCAWCTPDGFQCEQNKWTGQNSKGGSRCMKGSNKKYCDNVQGDCKHIDKCDYNAECTLNKSFNNNFNYYACKCNEGYTGNGIQCKDGNGTFSLAPNTDVEVEIEYASDLYTYPHTEGDFSYGTDLDSLFSAMSTNSVSCPLSGCHSEYVQANIPK